MTLTVQSVGINCMDFLAELKKLRWYLKNVKIEMEFPPVE